MVEDDRARASTAYAFGQLSRALSTQERAEDADVRSRAAGKADRWRAVVEGMTRGSLAVGSRTPVAGTPAWVTPEVVHGGFVTGHLAADLPLDAAESARLAVLPPEVPGANDRERLNRWYLSDVGRAELLAALEVGRIRIEVPEESALLVVALLVRGGEGEAALGVVDELAPWLPRLRFTPRWDASLLPPAGSVRLQTVGEVRDRLREEAPPAAVVAMNRTLRDWTPLYDRLVALWSETVDGDLPSLTAEGAVTGGWPARSRPDGWDERAARWLRDAEAVEAAAPGGRHAHPRSNVARLRAALMLAQEGFDGLSARDVGWVRRALANTVTAHGAPGSPRRETLRAEQAAIAARPTHDLVAHLVADRLAGHPADAGLAEVDHVVAPVGPGEAVGVPVATPIPAWVVRVVRRALEGPVEDLVAAGVIPSGEVLARVLEQVSARLMAEGVQDPATAEVVAQTYAAFRGRRSLLLLNLERQVAFPELPWIAAVLPPPPSAPADARRALTRSCVLALTSFPHEIVPNRLVREFGALATQAGLRLPLVEELAADIFMGRFAPKWAEAARTTSQVMAGTLYARYYDLPGPDAWAPALPAAPTPPMGRRWPFTRTRARIRDQHRDPGHLRPPTAADFGNLCRARAETEAGPGSNGRVAAAGAQLEQSQILTSHNLAVLVEALELRGELTRQGADLAAACLDWVLQRHRQPWRDCRTTSQMLRSTAYAWRQAVFFLSFADRAAQRRVVQGFAAGLTAPGAPLCLVPAAMGLRHVVDGGRLGADGTAPDGGRRFLGWAVGRHWMIPEGRFDSPVG